MVCDAISFNKINIIFYIILTIFIMFVKIESKAIAQLCALSYMIPPKGRIRTKKGHWKPLMIECEDSLVMHVTV